jgi:hypothetical protein
LPFYFRAMPLLCAAAAARFSFDIFRCHHPLLMMPYLMPPLPPPPHYFRQICCHFSPPPPERHARAVLICQIRDAAMLSFSPPPRPLRDSTTPSTRAGAMRADAADAC